ncbi:hypothetical protein IX51_03690 [uncultured archaeon]|nr:hypothetical protein IX51_03690 [uncultured archaeon]HKJ96387.1 carboxymuconolactone decarboxylase family protein [Thermoplasmataceae archaeon]
MKGTRIDYGSIEPEARKIISLISRYVRNSTLEPKLVELVRIRVSQINGCAFCIDMHTQNARAAGETEQRLYCLSAWVDSPFYSEREKTALEFAEYLSDIGRSGIPDHLYHRVLSQFNENEYIAIVMLVNEISSWNRLSISCGATSGMYKGKNTV